jgi:hypothetical protein
MTSAPIVPLITSSRSVPTMVAGLPSQVAEAACPCGDPERMFRQSMTLEQVSTTSPWTQ